MTIWIDGDGCPSVIKEIVCRAAVRTATPTCMVSNQRHLLPDGEIFSSIQVDQGYNSADDYIIQHVGCNDIVVTADIPLAAEIVKKGAIGISPRGEIYTEETVGERLSIRNFMKSMREAGYVHGGSERLSHRDRRIFSGALDRELIKRCGQQDEK